MGYQTLRSVSDHHVFVVCCDGRFYELVPEDVRKLGPWQGQHHGEIDKLKAEYRGARPGRLCAGEVRARGVQAGGGPLTNAPTEAGLVAAGAPGGLAQS